MSTASTSRNSASELQNMPILSQEGENSFHGYKICQCVPEPTLLSWSARIALAARKSDSGCQDLPHCPRSSQKPLVTRKFSSRCWDTPHCPRKAQIASKTRKSINRVQDLPCCPRRRWIHPPLGKPRVGLRTCPAVPGEYR